MSDNNNRACHVNTVEQIIGNMTPETSDGRYVTLSFSAQTPVSDQLNNVPDCLSHISDPLTTVSDHLGNISDHLGSVSNHVNIGSDIMNNRVSDHLNCGPDGRNSRRMVSDHLGDISDHLGLTSDPLNWIKQGSSYNIGYNPQFMNSDGHLRKNKFQQNANGFIQQSPTMFENMTKFQNANINDFSSYQSSNLPQSLYHNHEFLPHNIQNIMHDPAVQDSTSNNTNHAQLIENLVGNWVVPNNTGTYTPFGSSEAFKPSVFDFHRDSPMDQTEELKFQKSELIDDKFNFNRSNQKPRMVAEVKPMRPSYSDVLTKPVIGPSTSNSKSIKTEAKDTKTVKGKENKKSLKLDKNQKASNVLNRSNPINDKDVTNNEKLFNKTTERKVTKLNQLNRKWNSLDNISESNVKTEDLKKKRVEDNSTPKFSNRQSKNKVNKTFSNILDDDQELPNTETYNITKTTIKKSGKTVLKQRLNENQNGTDRPNAKRLQRGKKKDNHIAFGAIRQKMRHYTKGWWKVISAFILWLFNVISDICSISIHLGRDLAIHAWFWLTVNWFLFTSATESILKKWRYSAWLWEKLKGKPKSKEGEIPESFLPKGLETNINMPTTGDDAMKRLLACKGKDPYSILGVTPTCTDDDIKRYYKRQAFLVHPDKNNQPGAEEAFKILVHAFDMIGIPERREAYDRGVAESAFMVQNFTQMAELLQRLQQKMEMNANTIRCSSCGDRHKRIKVDRPCYAARNCNMCKIHHSAREGDIWAEAKVMGFLWHYYACMEGAIYDITDWAGCQKDTLKHLKPDSHHVQYRIALGKQNNSQPRRNSNNNSPRMDRPDLENLLSSLYGHAAASGDNGNGTTQKRRNKNKK